MVAFAVSEWSTSHRLISPVLSSAPLWVQIYSVPPQLWSDEGIELIASGLGDVIPNNPPRKSVSGDARIRVLVNLLRPIPSTVAVKDKRGDMVKVKVSVERLPPLCPTCSRYGHQPHRCPLRHSATAASPTPISNSLAASNLSLDADHRPRSPTRRRRRRSSSPLPPVSKTPSDNSAHRVQSLKNPKTVEGPPSSAQGTSGPVVDPEASSPVPNSQQAHVRRRSPSVSPHSLICRISQLPRQNRPTSPSAHPTQPIPPVDHIESVPSHFRRHSSAPIPVGDVSAVISSVSAIEVKLPVSTSILGPPPFSARLKPTHLRFSPPGSPSSRSTISPASLHPTDVPDKSTDSDELVDAHADFLSDHEDPSSAASRHASPRSRSLVPKQRRRIASRKIRLPVFPTCKRLLRQ